MVKFTIDTPTPLLFVPDTELGTPHPFHMELQLKAFWAPTNAWGMPSPEYLYPVVGSTAVAAVLMFCSLN